jgi:hypothetical protein
VLSLIWHPSQFGSEQDIHCPEVSLVGAWHYSQITDIVPEHLRQLVICFEHSVHLFKVLRK